MRPPLRHRARPGAGRAVKLAALWGGIGLAAAGFGTAFVYSMTRPPDAAELCARGSAIETSTLVIVDTTDTLSEIQRRRVRVTIERERDRLSRGGKLSVLAINAKNPGEPTEIVSACDPGAPQEMNPFFETVGKAEKRWDDAFAAPLAAAITRAGEAAGAANSPIIETVAAALTRPDFDARVPHRRLILISDMLENNSGGYSQLAGRDFWKAYLASALPRIAPLDLRGVAVGIDYLARPAYAAVQGERHREFWRWLFSHAGATEVTFIGLLPPAEPVSIEAEAPKIVPLSQAIPIISVKKPAARAATRHGRR